jgi:gamma-glutamyl-gamma-aminobutyrate hydrolase PuuD
MSIRNKVIIGGSSGYGDPYREALGEDYEYYAVSSAHDLATREFDFATVKAVVFTGGADIDPAFYSATDTTSSGMWRDEGHDALDRALLEAIDAHEREAGYGAILKYGTCRGAQLLFVHYTGGSLIQHIDGHTVDEHVGWIVGHYDSRQHHAVVKAHGVGYTTPRTAPAAVSINSIHHQALNWQTTNPRVYAPQNKDGHFVHLYSGERIPQLLMVGESEGQTCVEAWTHLGFGIMGFQYHPEWMDRDTDGYKWSIGAIKHIARMDNDSPWDYPRYRSNP